MPEAKFYGKKLVEDLRQRAPVRQGKRHKKTLEAVGEHVGYSQSTLSQIANGHCIPGIHSLLDLCTRYNLDPKDYFGVEE